MGIKLKNIIKKLLRKMLFGHKGNNEDYIKYLRKKGYNIGDGVVIHDIRHTFIDPTRPFLIDIGDNVQITRGVTILTHGYDWAVLKNINNEMLGSAGKVTIGNNVFIGMNSTVLKNVTIGDNVIIGANSLVNKDVPSNTVYAGNPAKFVCTLDDYYKKRKVEYINEAKEMALAYYQKYNKVPPIRIFDEFFPLFLSRDIELVKKHKFSFAGKYEEKMVNSFLASKPMFSGYEEFLKWCGIPISDKSI